MTQREITKEELLAKRNELRARLESIEADYRRGLDADSEERATQLANADVLDGIARATAEELQRLEVLLAKMK